MDYWNHALWSDETKIKLTWFRWCQACVTANSLGVQRQLCTSVQRWCQAWWWECHGLGLHDSCRHRGATVHWGNHGCQHVWSRAWSPSFGDWAAGQQIYTVIQAVHSLLYIVAKCHFFSVVTWKYIIKYLQKCEGCTHFCDWIIWGLKN